MSIKGDATTGTLTITGSDVAVSGLTCTDCVALGSETSGNYAASAGEAGDASGLACTDCVALSTETSGNYAAGDAEAGNALNSDACSADATCEVGILSTTGDGTIGGGDLTINKEGTYWSSIYFPAETNDPGYIHHYENNNAARLELIPGDDWAASDIVVVKGTGQSDAIYLRTDGYLGVEAGIYDISQGTLFVSDNLQVGGNVYVTDAGYLDDDTTAGGTADDWIKFSGYIEMRSDTDSYGIVLRDKDTSSYFGITQVDGYSYLTDSSTYGNYFIRGDGANVVVRGDLTVNGADIYVGTDSGSDDDYIYFDSGTSTKFGWYEYFATFYMNDDFWINGELTVGGDTAIGTSVVANEELYVYGTDAGTRVTAQDDGGDYAGFRSKNSNAEWFTGIISGTDWVVYNNAPGSGAKFRVMTDGDIRNYGNMYTGNPASAGSSTWCYSYISSNYYLLGYCSSSIKYKENVVNLDLGLETLRELRPVEFDWKNNNSTRNKRDFGFIAEEVEEVNPLLVEYGDEDGSIQSVRYRQITAIIANAIKEQQIQIEELQDKINELENERID